MLRKLQAGAAMADGKIRSAEWPGLALLQAFLQQSVVHAIDKEEQPRSEFNDLAVM